MQLELGLETLEFAYPYGGKEHMTKQRLQLVKEVGYTACLSAYGGSNVSHVDQFNVLRRGIYFAFSDAAFLSTCFGLR